MDKNYRSDMQLKLMKGKIVKNKDSKYAKECQVTANATNFKNTRYFGEQTLFDKIQQAKNIITHNLFAQTNKSHTNSIKNKETSLEKFEEINTEDLNKEEDYKNRLKYAKIVKNAPNSIKCKILGFEPNSNFYKKNNNEKETLAINKEDLKILKNSNKDPSINWHKFLEKNSNGVQANECKQKKWQKKIETSAQQSGPVEGSRRSNRLKRTHLFSDNVFGNNLNGVEAWDVEASFDNSLLQ